MMEAMVDCSVGKSSDIDDLPYELYQSSILGVFGHLLAGMYANWQQNGRIPISVHWRR